MALHTGNLKVTFHVPFNFRSWAPSPSCYPNNGTGQNAVCIKMTASAPANTTLKVTLIIFSFADSQHFYLV